MKDDTAKVCLKIYSFLPFSIFFFLLTHYSFLKLYTDFWYFPYSIAISLFFSTPILLIFFLSLTVCLPSEIQSFFFFRLFISFSIYFLYFLAFSLSHPIITFFFLSQYFKNVFFLFLIVKYLSFIFLHLSVCALTLVSFIPQSLTSSLSYHTGKCA